MAFLGLRTVVAEPLGMDGALACLVEKRYEHTVRAVTEAGTKVGRG